MPNQADSHYLSIFTPSQTDPEDLEAIFVQREALLLDAIERIIESIKTKNKQHQLIVGGRGSGKSHLVSLLVHRLSQKKEISKKLRIAWLNEDETCTTFLDLLINTFDSLNKRYPAEFPVEEIQPVYDNKPAEAQVFLSELLAEKLKKSKQTCLILIENLDSLFESIGDKGQKQLRAYLQENPLFTLFTTAQKLTDDLKNRNDPFFGFFQTEHLKSLTEKQAANLIGKIAKLQNKKEVSEFLKTDKGKMRIKALHHLSGGNHRVYLVLSQFISRDSIDSLVQPFLKMVDEMTPYYQERLRWLPPVQRKIIEALSATRTTLSVKQIAKQLFSSNQTISSQLKELKDKGYVKSHKRGRESLYEMTEPLMRICVEVKDNQSNKPIAILVEFIRAWYDGRDLQDRLGKKELSKLSKQYLSAAFEKTVEVTRSYLQEKGLMMSGMKSSDLLSLADYTKIIESKNVSKDQLCDALFFRSNVFLDQEKLDLSIDDLSHIIKIPDAPVVETAIALFNRGISYGKQGKTKQEVADYTQLIELSDAPAKLITDALFNRGLSYRQQGKTEQAIADYTQLIELKDVPNDEIAEALFNRALAYSQQNKTEQAIENYTQIIDLPKVPTERVSKVLINRGSIYGHQGKTKKALSDFEEILSLKDVPAEIKIKAHLYSATANILQNEWSKAKLELKNVFSIENYTGEYYILGVVSSFYDTFIDSTLRKKNIAELLEIFKTNKLALNSLGASLIKHLGHLFQKDSVPLKDNLISWRDAWQSGMQGVEELEVTQRIFLVGMEFLLSNNDEAVLLDLVESEREILRQTFQLDS